MDQGLMLQTVGLPGIAAILFFFVFTYLCRETCGHYFHAWRWAWGKTFIYYVLLALQYWFKSALLGVVSKLALAAVVFFIYASSRMMRNKFEVSRTFAGLAILFLVWAAAP